MEIPMFLLAVFWMYLFVVELISGLSRFQEYILYVVWALFVLEYLVKLILAPRKFDFIKHNWITLIALVVPVFRIFRIFYALRVLQSVRFINSTKIIRALTTGKRFFSELKEAQGPTPDPEMYVGILIAVGQTGNEEDIKTYVHQLINDVNGKLEDATGIKWFFEIADTLQLENGKVRSPSEFLDSASQIMAEGPYDIVSVITDVGLMSRKKRIEAGLCSSVARIMVISTRKLITTGRNKETRSLHDEHVRFNSALLFLHLTGHILGLKDVPAINSKIMGAVDFNSELKTIPSYNAREKEILRKKAPKAPDRELKNGNTVETFIFHVLMTSRHLKDFFKPLLESRPLLLFLFLPGLATAAIAPALILIFTAETWDVGLGMTNGTAAFFAVVSILCASFYLVRIQSLFLPRKEKRIVTEHLAVANSVIYFSIFFACIGLFSLVTGLMLVIEIYIFPPDLIQTWPTLNKPEVSLTDKIRLAVFISTVGVTTGALAGGLESRTFIQNLALFREKP